MSVRSYKLVLMTLAAGMACTLLVMGLSSLPARADEAALPPRPATHTPAAGPAPNGALIVLRVAFGETWPETGLEWQDLWTVVEWQDARGSWHAVTGWQGSLDAVADEVGTKQWWLHKGLCGAGPFRWLVLERQGGVVLDTSEPFYLPAGPGQVTVVEVALTP
jgi:hypothetical protein